MCEVARMTSERIIPGSIFWQWVDYREFKEECDIMDIQELQKVYSSKGFKKPIGFGEKPAVLVIDAHQTFTDISCPLGCSLEKPLQEISKVLKVARKAKIPIFFTVCAYQPDSTDVNRLWLSKVAFMPEYFVPGSKWVEVDPILERQPKEIVIVKKYPSAFFGTDLVSMLNNVGVDTLIMTGFTTSGCLRASVVDGICYEYRVIVVEEGVGDRADLTHQVNLADIDAKYADVVPLETVINYLDSFIKK
jgi:nicotinamidase-related amidase